MAYPRMFLAAGRNFRRMLPLMRDARVPTAVKASTAILALLIVSPLDVLGDIPVLGLLDDAVLLTLLCSAFVWLATRLVEKNVTPVREISGPPMVQ